MLRLLWPAAAGESVHRRRTCCSPHNTVGWFTPEGVVLALDGYGGVESAPQRAVQCSSTLPDTAPATALSCVAVSCISLTGAHRRTPPNVATCMRQAPACESNATKGPRGGLQPSARPQTAGCISQGCLPQLPPNKSLCAHTEPLCRQHARAGLAATSGPPSRTPPSTPASKAASSSSATYLEYVKPLIEAYTEAVALGSKRVLHALPRLLTALLEFGSDAVLVKQAALKSPRPPMLDTLASAMRKQTDKARRRSALPPAAAAMPQGTHVLRPRSCARVLQYSGLRPGQNVDTDRRGARAHADDVAACAARCPTGDWHTTVTCAGR